MLDGVIIPQNLGNQTGTRGPASRKSGAECSDLKGPVLCTMMELGHPKHHSISVLQAALYLDLLGIPAVVLAN